MSLRDIQPIWDVVSQILFYCSPVIISVETVNSEKARALTLFHLYMLNPLAVVFQQFRHAMITHHDAQRRRSARQLGRAAGAARRSCSAIFALGFWVFNRSAPLVAENL